MNDIVPAAQAPLPDQVDPEMGPPPTPAREGPRHEVMLHWVVTLGGFSAMLLIGWLFAR